MILGNFVFKKPENSFHHCWNIFPLLVINILSTLACPKIVSFIKPSQNATLKNHNLIAPYLSIAFIKCNCNVFSINFIWKPLKIFSPLLEYFPLLVINILSTLACPKIVSFIKPSQNATLKNHNLIAPYLSIAFIKCNCNVFSINFIWKPLKIFSTFDKLVLSKTKNILSTLAHQKKMILFNHFF